MKAILVIAVLISIPTMALWMSPADASPSKDYIPANYAEALVSMKGYEEGVLLASPEISLRAPYYAEKRALLSSVPSFDTPELVQDYETFYSPGTGNDGRAGILEKYGIRYVILGPRETANNIDFGDLLTHIKSFGEVKVYKVVS